MHLQRIQAAFFLFPFNAMDHEFTAEHRPTAESSNENTEERKLENPFCIRSMFIFFFLANSRKQEQIDGKNRLVPSA